jgi:hypothetical protein
MVALPKFRYSTRFPHLCYELTRKANGSAVVTFRHGNAFEVYVIANGRAEMVDCSDRYSFTSYHYAMGRHVSETVRAMADKTNRKAA